MKKYKVFYEWLSVLNGTIGKSSFESDTNDMEILKNKIGKDDKIIKVEEIIK
jgi:hypothetical protein